MRIPRPEYLEKLIDSMGINQVKIITGIRRCGKSYLLSEIFKDHLLGHGARPGNIFEMAFDKYENRKFRKAEAFFAEIEHYLDSTEGDRFIFLDEVQLLEDFVEILNSLVARKGVDVYATGSNAKLLSKDIATEFRGRGMEIHMMPLSFSEFMQVYSGDKREGYREYSVYGGLPSVVLRSGDRSKMDYLDGLFSEIYLNDIVERNNVRNIRELEQLVDVLASGIGSPTNPLNISNTFKTKLHSSLSRDTVEKFIGYLEDSFLVERAIRFDIKGRKYIGTPMKYYFTDLGLRNSQLQYRQIEPNHMMENVIYNELVHRGFKVDVGVVDSVRRDREGKNRKIRQEVDFVCNDGSARYYVQSAYALSDDKKLEQEISPLLKIDDSFKKVIITMEETIAHYDANGILTMNLYDFLLNPSSLKDI